MMKITKQDTSVGAFLLFYGFTLVARTGRPPAA